MLPCRSGCPQYLEGCHKSCPRWASLSREKQMQAEQRKAYLAYHSQRCRDILRGCYRISPHFSRY